MLSLFTRKPKAPVEAEPIAPEPYIETEAAEPVRRVKQQNIKASDDCCAAFAAIADAQGISKAALFEDMVAERFEALRRQGMQLGSAGR